MLTWNHKIAERPDTDIGTVWMGTGGDGMAVIAGKERGYELTAWWTGQKGKGQLTPQPPDAYPTLEAAQDAANRLIFGRTPDWTRLLEDPDDAS